MGYHRCCAAFEATGWQLAPFGRDSKHLVGNTLVNPTYETGVFRGGVLSPLMWLLLIYKVPGRARGALRTVASGLGARGDFTIQLFADDSSVAIRGQGGLQLIKLAHNLVGIRERAFGEIGLALSVLKRKNFPVRALDESRVYLREGVQLPDG